MDTDEAIALILREGQTGREAPPDAIHIQFRMGDDPGTARMQNLISALRAAFKSLEGQDQIDRNLASALWLIGDMVLSNTERCGRNRREFCDEALEIHAIIESIFFGAWFCTTPPP